MPPSLLSFPNKFLPIALWIQKTRKISKFTVPYISSFFYILKYFWNSWKCTDFWKASMGSMVNKRSMILKFSSYNNRDNKWSFDDISVITWHYSYCNVTLSIWCILFNFFVLPLWCCSCHLLPLFVVAKIGIQVTVLELLWHDGTDIRKIIFYSEIIKV